MGSELGVAIDILGGLIKASPAIASVIRSLTGESTEDTLARLERARAQIHDPIDTSADDAARRAELDRILRGSR